MEDLRVKPDKKFAVLRFVQGLIFMRWYVYLFLTCIMYICVFVYLSGCYTYIWKTTQAISTTDHYYCVIVMCPLLVKEKERRKKIKIK